MSHLFSALWLVFTDNLYLLFSFTCCKVVQHKRTPGGICSVGIHLPVRARVELSVQTQLSMIEPLILGRGQFLQLPLFCVFSGVPLNREKVLSKAGPEQNLVLLAGAIQAGKCGPAPELRNQTVH